MSIDVQYTKQICGLIFHRYKRTTHSRYLMFDALDLLLTECNVALFRANNVSKLAYILNAAFFSMALNTMKENWYLSPSWIYFYHISFPSCNVDSLNYSLDSFSCYSAYISSWFVEWLVIISDGCEGWLLFFCRWEKYASIKFSVI